MDKDLQMRAVQRAAQLKGGADSLAPLLGVSDSTLLLWMQGKATVPAQAFEKVLDLLLDVDLAALGGGQPEAVKAPARVLVVDDDAAGAYGLARVLRGLGHPVETASDGPSAIAAARRLKPEVVFLDLRMPGMDGVEIARVLKAEGLGAHIIAATSFPAELQTKRTTAAGFSRHVMKPIEASALEKLLAELR